jgi:hypothetical protein
MHAEAGLLHSQGKRSFTSEGVESAGDTLDNIEDPLDFDQLSDHLIAGAASANGDKDIGDIDNLNDELPPRPVLTINISPLNLATHLASSGPVKVAFPSEFFSRILLNQIWLLMKE